MVTKITSKKYGTFDLYYDSDDHDLVVSYKWFPKKDSRNGRFYAYAWIDGLKKCVFLHTLIMDKQEGMVIDHRNGVGLDNRKCNLRLATRSQNSSNQSPKNKVKGVSKDKYGYRVRITLNKKVYDGGRRFKTLGEALVRYNELALLYHGEFASLNN